MSATDRSSQHWITHRYFRTYAIAGRLTAIARDPFASIHTLEDLTVNDGVIEFLQNWSKDTVVHKFARWLAHSMFLDDTDGPYVIIYESCTERRRYLPVDLALRSYGFSTDAFAVPPPDGEYVKNDSGVLEWHESVKVADACYDYFTEGLMWSEEYEELLGQIADEVFHILFLNRGTMMGLNKFIAMHVEEYGYLANSGDSTLADVRLDSLFTKKGRIKRVRIPTWAKRAVFFRDHGRCTSCGRDLSSLLDSLPAEQFDHIVPLAGGGLNDVTNLQLLCQPCNTKKSDKATSTSNKYRRWYESNKRAEAKPTASIDHFL